MTSARWGGRSNQIPSESSRSCCVLTKEATSTFDRLLQLDVLGDQSFDRLLMLLRNRDEIRDQLCQMLEDKLRLPSDDQVLEMWSRVEQEVSPARGVRIVPDDQIIPADFFSLRTPAEASSKLAAYLAV